MSESLLILAYGITIVASTMAGGYLPQIVRMNHIRMQVVLSFVGGMMLGVAVLHLLPHGFQSLQKWTEGSSDPQASAISITMRAMLVGLLFTFFMMRAFHFHQHAEGDGHEHEPDNDRDHPHDARPMSKLGWIGVIFGLGLHTFVDGIALGAAVMHDSSHSHTVSWAPAGFGVYLAILLHKPLDALSITTLMTADNRSWLSIQTANACFGLVCLAGAICAAYLPAVSTGNDFWLGCLLAGSAGVFLCISLSDLLPEVQFHRHDRIQLSTALLLGISIAFVLEMMHRH